VPPSPGNVSAFGLLAVDLKTDYVATQVQREDCFDPGILDAGYRRLEAEAERHLAAEGVPLERRRYLSTADMRYFGEAFEVRIEMPSGRLTDASLRQAVERFHDAHEKLYGYSYRGEQLTEIVNLRITGIGLIDKPSIAPAPETGRGSSFSFRERRVFFDGEFIPWCIVYARDQLSPGVQLASPCIVEEYGSTTVIQPGQSATVDAYGNLIIRTDQGVSR
jgi:N-methylhydantoinase A